MQLTWTPSHGLQTGDVLTMPVRLSRWARLWRLIRYMRHNMPPEPQRTFVVTAVTSGTTVQVQE